MNILLEEHKKFVEQLLDQHVEFILVGGMAVIYYGYPRTTGDLDLWLKPTNENKIKFLEVLKKDKLFDDDIKYLSSLDFSKHLVFHIGEEPAKIDFLTHINGVNYTEADLQKNFFDSGKYKIPIIHLNHLVLSKLSSNRAKDKADVEELQKINNTKKQD
jgi:predicted nucleotidyltransferase